MFCLLTSRRNIIKGQHNFYQAMYIKEDGVDRGKGKKSKGGQIKTGKHGEQY